MSLIDNMMEDCVLIERTRVSDGEGGWTAVWSETSSFKAAIHMDTSIQARIAEQEGVTSVYTVTTQKANKLDFHDVFKRVNDGAIFRCTSNGSEVLSPSVSTLDISKVKAEKWELTS